MTSSTSTIPETQALLGASSADSDSHSLDTSNAVSASQPTSAASDSAEQEVSAANSNESTVEHRYRDPVTHYNSISVDCRFPSATERVRGTAQIVEHDVGAENDFWNIHLNFLWRPRKANASGEQLESTAISVSVDDMLALRVDANSDPPMVTLYLQGGRLLGQFYFPNGPDAAMLFVDTIRKHTDIVPLERTTERGELLAVERKSRMRRVAPSIATEPNPNTDEDFTSLLQDLNINSASATRDSRRREQGRQRRPPAEDNFGMMILSHFARVTQIAREVGDDISNLLDEKKRRTESARREREREARRRALDIYADIIASTDVERELPPRMTLDERRGTPVSLSAWNDSFDEKGVLMDIPVMRYAIFCGGVEPDARPAVWPFLLGFFSWESTREERRLLRESTNATYSALKGEWQSLQAAAKADDERSLAEDAEAITVDRRKRVSKPHAIYLEIEEQILKDIVRTDRQLDLFLQDDAPATVLMGTLLNVYATYDNRINYCQGMSDFLSPILHVLGVEEEALAFWCFESLMRRIEGNFRVDQSGMRAQLAKLKKLVQIGDKELCDFFEESDPDFYCCFRWVLVRFKRELSFEATERFWEALWTRQVGGDDLHIFVAGALLFAHRRQLLSLQRGAFDCLLRYVNDMCMRIDVDFALREGELCFRKFGDKVG